MCSDIYCARCGKEIPFFTPCYFEGDASIYSMCNDKRKTSTETKELWANDCEEGPYDKE